MRFRLAKKILCGLLLLAFLALTVLMMRSPDLTPPPAPTPPFFLRDLVVSAKSLQHSQQRARPHTHREHSPHPIPPNPPRIIHPPYPLPDGLQPFDPSALPGRGQAPAPGGRRVVKPDGQVFTFKNDGRYGSTTPPKPDLQAQGEVGQMLMELQRRRGAMGAAPGGPAGGGGDGGGGGGVRRPGGAGGASRRRPPPSPPPRRRPPVGIVEGNLKKADELWGLLQSVTKEPVKDSIQQVAHSHCFPKHHVFFGKVHKTGSSTVANILQRYGFTRQLNFVLPRKRIHSRSYNYITLPGQTVSHDKLIPPPLGEHYDILWNHGIYDSQFYHSILPADTVYVSILRQPLQQFQSAFEYYGHIPGSFLHKILQKNVSNPLSLYLQQPSLYEWPGAYTSYIRNKQSQDLGMKNVHVLNDTLRREYIQQLGKEFQLVMITEFFDESLVLLRRLMCWSVKDVLYIPKNKNVYKKKRVFSAKDRAEHRKLNVADYDLYDFFLKRFNDTVARQKPDFRGEVAYFKKLLQSVQSHCSRPGGPPVLKVPSTQWSAQFTVGPEDCKLMQKHELLFLDDLMVDSIRRYQKSASLL